MRPRHEFRVWIRKEGKNRESKISLAQHVPRNKEKARVDSLEAADEMRVG